MSGLGLTQMNSMLALQNSMKTMRTLSASRASLDGNMRVLKSEIETDKGRGIDTAGKEENYADMENNLNTIMEKLSGSAAETNDRIASGNEKIREKETEAITNTSNSREAEEGGTVTNSTDTVEISTLAHNIAAFAPQAAPEIHMLQAAQTGTVVDIKV